MIPSFYPVREHLDKTKQDRAQRSLTRQQQAIAATSLAARKICSINTDGLQVRTTDELLVSARRVRYPDRTWLSYPDMMSQESLDRSRSPISTDGGRLMGPRPMVVVGAGLSGLMAAWQLCKLGAQVTVYEAGPEPTGDNTNPVGAGRIFPFNAVSGNASTRGEFGAMRFPDTSFLFWHYMKLLVGSGTYTEFPNPGKIPTILSGESTLTPFWKPGGLELSSAYDSGYNYSALNSRHLSAFMDLSANGLTLRDVSTNMTNGNAAGNASMLNSIDTFWRTLQRRYHGITYRDFLISKGFTSGEIDVIGYLGLGTGGFKPLFDTSVLELMRLFIWNYASEYAVPELYMLPYKLKEAVRAAGGRIFYNTKVTGLAHMANNTYAVQFSSQVPRGKRGTSGVDERDYEYVVLAMSHKAAYDFLNPNADITFVNSLGGIAPYASTRYTNAESSQVVPHLMNQGAMSSVKIFQTIAGPNSSSIFPGLAYPTVTPASGRMSGIAGGVRSVFGKPGTVSPGADPLGVTYVLPLVGNQFSQSTAVLSLHYSWGVDAKTLRTGLLASDFRVKSSLDASGTFFGTPDSSTNTTETTSVGSKILSALNSRFSGKTTASGISNLSNFASMFNTWRSTSVRPLEGRMGIVDWDRVPFVNMAFKLDAPGFGLPLIDLYKKVALDVVNNRVGNSVSPLVFDHSNGIHRSVKRAVQLKC